MKPNSSPEKLSLKAALMDSNQKDELIDKLLLASKPQKSGTKSKEVKTKIIKTKNSKFINKYGSAQSLIKDEIVWQSMGSHGWTSPFFNNTIKSAREDARFIVPVSYE